MYPSKSLRAMAEAGNQAECRELFVQVVQEMAEKKGKRPSAKEVAKETGLDIEDAKAILSEIPPVKKQKTSPKPAATAPEPAAPSAVQPAEPEQMAVEMTVPDLAETQLDELAATAEIPKDEPQVDTTKPEADAKAEDAKSEAPTQVYERTDKSAPSPAEVKQQCNSEALQSLARPASQR